MGKKKRSADAMTASKTPLDPSLASANPQAASNDPVSQSGDISVNLEGAIDPSLPADRDRREKVPSLFPTTVASSSDAVPATDSFSFDALDFNSDMGFLQDTNLSAADNESLLRAIQQESFGPRTEPPVKAAKKSAAQSTTRANASDPTALGDSSGDGIVNGKIVDSDRLLSCKWYSSSKLNQMARDHGLQYKKGKFTKAETDAISAALEDYKLKNNLDDEGLRNVIFAKGSEQRSDGTFWRSIALSTPGRPVLAVYNHVQRTQDPRRCKGPWRPEEDEALRRAVAVHGFKWQKCSEEVGRTASDCKDRYRNYLAIEGVRKVGQWTTDEEDALKKAVLEVQGNLDKLEDSQVMWGVVAAKLGNTRSRQQCRAKWYDTHEREDVDKDKWSKMDDYVLIQRLAALDVRDASEIDWKKIPDATWNKFRSHKLREHWRNFRKRVLEANPHIEKDDFRSIIDILKAEQDAKVDATGQYVGKITKAGGAPKQRSRPPTSSVEVEDRVWIDDDNI